MNATAGCLFGTVLSLVLLNAVPARASFDTILFDGSLELAESQEEGMIAVSGKAADVLYHSMSSEPVVRGHGYGDLVISTKTSGSHTCAAYKRTVGERSLSFQCKIKFELDHSSTTGKPNVVEGKSACKGRGPLADLCDCERVREWAHKNADEAAQKICGRYLSKRVSAYTESCQNLDHPFWWEATVRAEYQCQ
jgi:hypothetical protein